MDLTQEQMDAYIKGGGNKCPYCGSCQLDGEGVYPDDWDGSTLFQEVTCLDCEHSWTDAFKLVAINPTA